MTFSIVARCAETGMFGTAVASSSPAVAARCSFVEAKTGAFSSQNITDPTLGTRGLSLMRSGVGAAETIDTLKREDANIAYRQILTVDKNGDAAAFSGVNTLGVNAEVVADNAACAGNLLADDNVINAMMDGFLHAEGHFGDRLLSALRAALQAGGEAGPIHSAGIKIADKTEWPFVDLRCDWSESSCPVEELTHTWNVYHPQMNDYIQRALEPAKAPRYHVPGELSEESPAPNEEEIR